MGTPTPRSPGGRGAAVRAEFAPPRWRGAVRGSVRGAAAQPRRGASLRGGRRSAVGMRTPPAEGSGIAPAGSFL